MYVEQRLLTRFIYSSLVVFLFCTSALLPAPVFSRQVNTIIPSASYANDSMEQLAQIINSQAKEKIIVTVDGKQYYIVVLKNRIDPATLKLQFTPDFKKEVKVYTNLDGTPVSNPDTVNKIQYIDSARRWSAGQASVASIKEDLQIIDDFTKAMLKVRAYQIALDWIATAGGSLVKLYICDSLNPEAFFYYVPEQLKSTFTDPKFFAALLGYKFMNDSKGYLENALTIAERGEINDYDTARQFMESYLRGWTEFSPAYSMVFESFVGGSWLNDLGDFSYKLAKSILPISLRKEFFGDIETAGMVLDMTPIYRFNQLKSECDRTRAEFFQRNGVHAKYTLELANAGILLRSSPAEPAKTASPPVSTQAEIVVDPRVSISPISGEQGTTFNEPGWGFTPNSTSTLYFKYPDGRQLTATERTDSQGRYSHPWTSSTTSPPGTYSYWAVDDKTGKVSNTVYFTIKHKATPVHIVDPKISVTPTLGPPSSTFEIRVTGCTPNNEVQIEYQSGEYDFATFTKFKTCRTDSYGNAITSLMVESYQYKGEHAIWATDRETGKKSEIITFTIGYPKVYPKLAISATSISRGQTLDIKVTGCTPNNKVKIDNEPVSAYEFGITDWHKTCNTDNSGTAITSIAWPLLGSVYKGKYTVWAIDVATKAESNRVVVTVK